MTISRRIFIRNGALAAAFSGVMFKTAHGATGDPASGTAAGVAAPGAGRARAALFAKESFTPHLNTQFMVRDRDAKAVRMTLAAVEDHLPHAGKRAAAARRPCECFSLQFRHDSGEALLQDTYRFEHPALGKFSLFIVPSRDAERRSGTYEAVINRL